MAGPAPASTPTWPWPRWSWLPHRLFSDVEAVFFPAPTAPVGAAPQVLYPIFARYQVWFSECAPMDGQRIHPHENVLKESFKKSLSQCPSSALLFLLAFVSLGCLTSCCGGRTAQSRAASVVPGLLGSQGAPGRTAGGSVGAAPFHPGPTHENDRSLSLPHLPSSFRHLFSPNAAGRGC